MIPISNRQVKTRMYHLIFAQGGEYGGCYARIYAKNVDRAREEAITRYGLKNYGGIEINEERARALIKAFRLKEVTA